VTGLFAESDDEGVVFVVNGDVGRQGIHKNLLQGAIMQSAVKDGIFHPLFFIINCFF
jgi:hypothetical protein